MFRLLASGLMHLMCWLFTSVVGKAFGVLIVLMGDPSLNN